VKVLVDRTFEQVFARAAEFDPEEIAFIVWLNRMAKAVLAVRAIQPIRKLPDVPEYTGREQVELDETAAAMGDPPDQQFMSKQLTNPRVKDRWARLTRNEQQVLWMLDVQGRHPKEAAKNLNLTLGTVNNNLSSGRRKLREGLS
jgi:RNA polymerase sigma factor (sigma-70 family)